jgi:hypothetical protein
MVYTSPPTKSTEQAFVGLQRELDNNLKHIAYELNIEHTNGDHLTCGLHPSTHSLMDEYGLQ